MVCVRRRPSDSVVERAGVHHGRDFTFAAKHHQQVAHHRGFAFLIHRYDRFSESSRSAMSTMLTAPCTILVRAAMTASACWRRSIACAISGA